MMLPEVLQEEARAFLGDARDEALVARAPGRVEILGNHTDYNGGSVLAGTIMYFVWTIGVPSYSDRVDILSTRFEEVTSFHPGSLAPTNTNQWSDYVQGIYWAIQRRRHTPVPIRAVVHGNIPLGAGLSSSAALEVSMVNLVLELSGISLPAKAKAMLAFEAERLYCSVACGIMDQFTSQLCKSESLLAIQCASMQTQDIPFPEDLSLLIVDTGVSRAAADALNQRRTECRTALSQLQDKGWDKRNLSQIAPRELSDVESVLDGVLLKRVRHIVMENERVRRGIRALEQGDLETLGNLLYESHESSRNLYDVSHPNLDLLVEILKHQKGVIGSRLTGAGFGGSVLAVVEREHVSDVKKHVSEKYLRESGIEPQIVESTIPGGVIVSKYQ
jgi:galactokinase